MITSLGAAIAIVHGDREGQRRGQSTASRGAVESGGYCAAKLPPLIEPFTLRVPKDPLRPSACGVSKRIDHAPFPLERKRRPWSIRFKTAHADGLSRC